MKDNIQITENIDNVLSIEEFLLRYKNDLLYNNITQDILNNMVATILEQEDNIISNIKYHVNIIFTCIINLKYFDYSVEFFKDQMNEIENSIIYLKNLPECGYDNYLKMDFYNLDKICYEVYWNIYNKYNHYKGYLSETIDEEFTGEHVLNLKYYLDKVKEYKKDNKEIIELIENKSWRYI